MRLLFRYFLRGVFVFLGLILLYGFLTLIGTFVAVNPDFQATPNGIPVYVSTNGFHTDVILPIQNRRDKCFRILQQPDLAARYADYAYVSFGWGDRNFYMESYNGNFPKTTTIVSTLFIPGQTLMHIDFYRYAPKPGKQVRKILLSAAQYEKLVDFVTASFRQSNSGLVKLPQAGYYDSDYFFEAEGKYHLFNTCNVWTGNALKQAGVKISYWTPLEHSVFYYLK